MFAAAIRGRVVNLIRVGSPDGATRVGGTGLPDDGPFIRFLLRIREGVALEAAWNSYGCAAKICVACAIAELSEGLEFSSLASMGIEEVRGLGNRTIYNYEPKDRLAQDATSTAGTNTYNHDGDGLEQRSEVGAAGTPTLVWDGDDYLEGRT